MTILDCLERGTRILVAAGFPLDEARRDVSVLLRHALGWSMAEWAAKSRDQAPDGLETTIELLARRRGAHEPVAYITGTREFYGREFGVTRAVLIPRPETELIVDELLRVGPAGSAGSAGPRILDVGTGSGCLAITIALEWPGARVMATDVSAEALEVARRNAQSLGAGVEFVLASLVPPNTVPFDVIVSNPPYVPLSDRPTLAPDVRDFEPSTGLFGGDDGLEVIRGLADAASRALVPGGWLLMEIGIGQSAIVSDIVTKAGLHVDRVVPDLQGIPRVLIARRPLADR